MRDNTAGLVSILVTLSLVGCSASDPGMGITPPSPIAGASPLSSPATELVPSPAQPTPSLAASRPGSAEAGPIQFLPLVGAPEEKVAMLSRALARASAANGVALAPAEGSVAPQRLKGYLSLLEEGPSTIVIYVWDVVDPQGVRLNRIQGQHRIAAAGGDDPWSVVDETAVTAIATATMREFRKSTMTEG